MSILHLHDRRMTNSMAATNLRSSSVDGHLSCASLQPTPLPFPLSNSPVLFRGRGWQGGKISSESRRLSSSLRFALGRRRLSKIVDWRRPIGQQASAHGHVKRAKQPCPTTTLLRGGPPTVTSHFASLTAADAHIPAACLFGHSSRLYAPSIGGDPAQPSLPRVRAICTLNSLKALADWAKLSSSSTSSFFLVSPFAAESAGSTVISEADLDPQRACGDPDCGKRVLHHRFRNLGTALGALACPEGQRSHRMPNAHAAWQQPRSLFQWYDIVHGHSQGYHLDLPDG